MRFKKLDDGYQLSQGFAPALLVIVSTFFIIVGGMFFSTMLVTVLAEGVSGLLFGLVFSAIWEGIALTIFSRVVLIPLFSPVIRIDVSGVTAVPRLPFGKKKHYDWHEIHDYGYFSREFYSNTHGYLILLYFSPDAETDLDHSGFHTVGRSAIRLSFTSASVPAAISEELLPYCECRLGFPPRQQ